MKRRIIRAVVGGFFGIVAVGLIWFAAMMVLTLYGPIAGVPIAFTFAVILGGLLGGVFGLSTDMSLKQIIKPLLTTFLGGLIGLAVGLVIGDYVRDTFELQRTFIGKNGKTFTNIGSISIVLISSITGLIAGSLWGHFWILKELSNESE